MRTTGPSWASDATWNAAAARRQAAQRLGRRAQARAGGRGFQQRAKREGGGLLEHAGCGSTG